MNPTITSPVPAKDSMGMDYIPVYADEDKQSSERKIVFYRNPMNPSVTSPVPAKDSMGMDYVPVYADNEQGGEASEVAGTVKIDPGGCSKYWRAHCYCQAGVNQSNDSCGGSSGF